MSATTKNVIIDSDTVTCILADAEHTRDASRAAIDEIATRVEAELCARELDGVTVERDYFTTGRRDDTDCDSGDLDSDKIRSLLCSILDAVLIDQVAHIRSALGLAMTIIIDSDTVAQVLTRSERTLEAVEAGIDEIADRVEAELYARELDGVTVDREYRTPGRWDDTDKSRVLWDDIRAALGLGTVAS